MRVVPPKRRWRNLQLEKLLDENDKCEEINKREVVNRDHGSCGRERGNKMSEFIKQLLLFADFSTTLASCSYAFHGIMFPYCNWSIIPGKILI